MIILIMGMGAAFAGCGAIDTAKQRISGSSESDPSKEEIYDEAESEDDTGDDNSSSGTRSLFSSDGSSDVSSDDTDDSQSSNEGSGETKDINTMTDEEASELAEFLSTDQRPTIYDWEFISAALWDGSDSLMEYFDDPEAVEIHNPLLVEGDWKCVTCPIPDAYSSGYTYIGNANIHSLNDKVSFTFDMWIEMEGTFEGESTEIEGGAPVKYTGKWNDDKAGFRIESDSLMIELEKFIYLDDTMYAIGKDMYISGEQDYVVLIRPESHMEIKGYAEGSQTGGGSSDGNTSGKDNTQKDNTQKDSSQKDTTQKEQKQQSSDTSDKYADIVEKARKKSGAPIAELDSIDPDGTLNIHLYEDAGDHTATWDWYYIDPNTLKGQNFMGDSIDLN